METNHYDQFGRKPTQDEYAELSTTYNRHHDAIDGLTQARIGDESLNPDMHLTLGQRYSKVVYCAFLDFFYWNHDNYFTPTPAAHVCAI